jgi:hypothetical protein
MQQFIDQAAPNLGETFTPTYAAYALNEQGVLTLVGGQFVVQAEDDSADYARQRLAEQIAGLTELDADLIYEPAYMFGSGAESVPGSFASVSIPADDGMPMKISFAAIDTATAHHMIYIVSTESAPMQALVEQLFALIQGAA